MKVLILNGSPRRHGNMSKMLELMKQELEGCGVGTVYIDVPQLQVHPCIGCIWSHLSRNSIPEESYK